MIKIVKLEKLDIFQTTWGISMKFLGKMCLIIILKVAKNQGLTPSLENTVLEKPQETPQSFKG